MPLKEGSQGSRVGSVQKALGLRSDRIFGPSTTRAVKRFQRRHGLTPDGVVGPSTWALIKRVRARQRSRGSAGRRTSAARVRTRGAAVRLLQRRLGLTAAATRAGTTRAMTARGSVSYALHGGYLLGSSRTSGGFMSWGAPGRGRWITVYAAPDHVYMVVNGVRFDTSGRTGRQSRWQHDMRDPGGHVARHPPGL